jgi:hypothetical protein
MLGSGEYLRITDSIRSDLVSPSPNCNTSPARIITGKEWHQICTDFKEETFSLKVCNLYQKGGPMKSKIVHASLAVLTFLILATALVACGGGGGGGGSNSGRATLTGTAQ